MTSWYNEPDPVAAQWLRNLIAAGHIANGVVDERSIEDVRPDELMGYTQCHFFAGIGIWSYALRQAGWPDERPVWTGSCPCQPFSAAGKGEGFDDERHLWPSWYWLIEQCKPERIYGEQVASKHADAWIDLVQADLEAMGYAFGAIPFPSAGIGAPHIRDRLYWMADANSDGREQGSIRRTPARYGETFESDCRAVGMANSQGGRLGEQRSQTFAASLRHSDGRIDPSVRMGNACGERLAQRERLNGILEQSADSDAREAAERAGICDGGVADTNDNGSAEHEQQQGERKKQGPADDSEYELDGTERSAGPTNGLWRAADWLFCRDGKWRPVEPGTFPLAHGIAGRVGRLRAYGNGLCAEAAIEFIKASLNC